MRHATVVLFCMGDRGHFQRLRSLIAGLSRLSVRTCVFTHRSFQAEVEQAGGVFADLFSHGSVEDADDESWPFTVRYVTFAATFAEQVRRDVEAFSPSLVIGDTFAVIARAIANQLAVPYVNVCAGHNVVPERFVALMEAHPRAKVSRRCLEAVQDLRRRYGMANASPFSYASGLSRHLNIYCEPPAFLDDVDRGVFEPIAFYGSLPDPEAWDPPSAPGSFFPDAPARLKVYLSFGTVVWGYREAEALGALASLVGAFERLGNVRAVISLGEPNAPRSRHDALARPGVSVVPYVDQWRILQEADLFVTHHGLNSTHEAIFHRVPMISYPFVWDQPGLAGTCQRLGLAVPLVTEPMADVSPADADLALSLAGRERTRMLGALAVASGWERQVVADRPAVLRRILALATRSSTPGR